MRSLRRCASNEFQAVAPRSGDFSSDIMSPSKKACARRSKNGRTWRGRGGAGFASKAFVIDGPMNGTIFLAYVEQCLAPTLDRRDVVIMDNLPAHKVAGVTDAIEAVGATAFYLPPYSPDLNPIEQVFSKLKALLRKAAERTVPKLWRRIRALLRTISDEECLNFFRHAGYASM